MLRVHLGVEDWGRVRFADAPAPVLEMVLMLFELRNRPHLAGHGDHDWRALTRTAFPEAARPLLLLVPSRERALYLDVLTPDAQEAFHLVRDTPRSVHADNLDRIQNAQVGPTPRWLRRYADRDPAVLQTLDRALRTFHATCLDPQWSSVTTLFRNDIALRTATFRQHGLATMLNVLSPDLRLNGPVLEGRYPYDRRVDLNGAGLVLMPSAFWTGHPLITWDPQDQSRHVLIYPTHRTPEDESEPTTDHGIGDPLGALLGQTRARVLRSLHQPRTTSGVARHTRISMSSASGHTTTLREAGLITSHREGQAVRHHLTPLGRSFLDSNAPAWP